MNKPCLLVLISSFSSSVLAQTNTPLAPLELFSIPSTALRAGNVTTDQPLANTTAFTEEPARLARTNTQSITTNFSIGLPTVWETGGSTNGNRVVSVAEELVASASQTEFDLQLFKRLEQGGYLTRRDPASDNLLVRATDAVFTPEVFQFRKVAISCSLLTAIKRKNPLCLLNPIFLNVSW